MNASQRLAEIEAIYATIPKVNCQRLCGHEVCGPIALTGLELRRIKQVAPKVTTEVWPVLGRVMNGPGNTCPLLTPDGACSIYEHRPAICRLFGAVEALRCPHGCEPERWLTEAESRAILAKIKAFGAA